MSYLSEKFDSLGYDLLDLDRLIYLQLEEPPEGCTGGNCDGGCFGGCNSCKPGCNTGGK